MMVESEAYELSEAEMLGAVKFGHEQMQPVIDLIIDFAPRIALEGALRLHTPPDYADLYGRVKAAARRRCVLPSRSSTSRPAPTRSLPPSRQSRHR